MPQVSDCGSRCLVIPNQGINHKPNHERKVDVLILRKRIAEALENIAELCISPSDGCDSKKLVVQDLPGVRELSHGVEVAVPSRARTQGSQAEPRITRNDVELESILIQNVELAVDRIHFPQNVLAI